MPLPISTIHNNVEWFQSMARFTFKIKSKIKSLCADRPCLEDRVRVQRVQRSVELGLTHILHRDNQESLMHKVCVKPSGYSETLLKTSTFILSFPSLCSPTFLTAVESTRVNLSVASLQLYQRMAVLRSLCSLHMEKLRWFSQRYPLTAHSLFPPLYKELFASEAELLPAATHWWQPQARTSAHHFKSRHYFLTESIFLIIKLNEKSTVIIDDFQRSLFW